LPTEQGVKFGPTIKQGIGDLIDQDPLAEWDPLTKSVTHSEYAISPRIIPVVLFDPDEFLSHDPSGKSYVLVTNILGFFVAERESGKDKGVLGYLCALPGNFASGPSVIDPSSFVRTIQLVR
jgi:hypothetical protein